MASLGSSTLDCFRNGSVIQLKSKSTGKTLTVRQGGSISGNGPAGFYAGYLGPRTPVWGRWKDGTYHRGTMTDVDTQFHIRFNDGDTISHDIHDQTAVLADIQPDPEVVQTGSRVIAQFRGSARYYAGRIMKVDRANPSNPRCDIHFDDGDKDSVNLNALRMLPEITSSALGTPPILTNSRVIGRWTNNKYYHGRVTSVGSKVDITFDDGDKVQHDPSDVGAVVYDVNPSIGTIQVGTRVVGFWPKSKLYYLGRVLQVDYMNPQFPTYLVCFDDGDQIWCNLNQIRPVPLRREQVGCVVWGRWTNNLYYHGYVTGTSGGKIHVTFDDGDKVSHNLSDISAVLIDMVPNPVQVPMGSRVIAAWKEKPMYYKGTVTQVDQSFFYAPRYYVQYDDGDKGWQTFTNVRLLPMRVDEVGSRVWGRWKNYCYYPGKVESVDSKIHIKFDDGDKTSHDPSDITAVILDTSPNSGAVLKGSRVIAAWPNRTKYYPGYVDVIDKKPHEIRYHVKYDDGDEGWVNVDKLKMIPAPGPAQEAQFKVINLNRNVVALNSIAYPQYFLGSEDGRLTAKTFDNNCHFCVHETPDHYVFLEFCMFPGQHAGVYSDGTTSPPANTYKSDQAFFEVKLLLSPYGQIYKADHSFTGGYPAPTPNYPQPGQYPPPQPYHGGYAGPPEGYPGYTPAVHGGYPAPPPQYPMGGPPPQQGYNPMGGPPPQQGYNHYPGGYPGYGPPPPY